MQKLIFSLILAFQINLVADGMQLWEVKEVSDTLLSLHVEQKSFNERLARRALRVYLQRFDPYHIYLTETEAKKYLTAPESFTSKLASDYEKGQFDQFFTVADTLHKATLRARTMRSLIRTKLLKEREINLQEIYLGEASYADSIQELQDRVEKQMRSWLAMHALKYNLKQIDPEMRLKILNHYEKKRRSQETPYLLSSKQTPIHIAKAIAGSLDSHTMVYSPEEARDIRTSLYKQFFGVGLYLREDIDGPTVTGFIEKSPAERSGLIAAGDVLTKIDLLSTEDLAFTEIMRRLDGENQSNVCLAFRSSDGIEKEIQLTREKITLDNARIQIAYEPFLDGVIATVKLPAFYDNGEDVQVENDLREAIQDLKSQGPIYGLILDMRQNHGGFLHQAIKVSSLFIQKGVIVVAKYADEEIRYARDLDPRSSYNGPLVVLTSKASASAAEVVAQSLKDLGAAVIVGDEQTYGKGSMQLQTLTDPKAKYFFKVTVGRYYTVSGKSTQLKGVPADIVVPTEYAPYELGERYLSFPLSSDQISCRTDLKGTLQKVFASYQSRVPTHWEVMLPILRRGSEKRLQEDKNYHAFLKHIHDRRVSPFANQKPEYGRDDLQVKEAVNIIKDMVYIDRQGNISVPSLTRS